MPRDSQRSSKPSAANRFAKTRNGAEDGKQLRLADVATAEEWFSLIEDAVQVGVAVTIAPTRDRNTIALTFFHDGVRYPWYLVTGADFQEVLQETAI